MSKHGGVAKEVLVQSRVQGEQIKKEKKGKSMMKKNDEKNDKEEKV